MLEVENQSGQDLDNLIKKVLVKQKKELNEIKYITEKTNYFYHLLMGNLIKINELDENTILLVDKITHKEYLSYYNNLTKAICIFKKPKLCFEDFFNSAVREMIWEESKQYFINFENGILRVDVLNSYIFADMVTSFYDINKITDIIREHNYNTLWELISSYEFQTNAIPENTICSEIRADINGEPKCQTIYSIKDKEKQFILRSTTNKEKNKGLNPFENHEQVVNLAIQYRNTLQKKL